MSKSRFKLDSEKIGIHQTLEKQCNNFFKDRYNVKINETDKYTKNVVNNFIISISNHGKMGKITNFSTKHVVDFVNDMKELGYPNKQIKDAVSRLQDFNTKIGCKKSLVDSKVIFKMCDVGKREDAKIERQWSQREYDDMIKIAREKNREDVVIAMKLSRSFGTRLEGTMSLKPKQIEKALTTGELRVVEKGGKERYIKVSTNTQTKLLKELRKLYKTENLKSNDSIFRDSKILNAGKTIRNGNNVGKCMDSVQNFIGYHRNKVQDKDRKDLKDRDGKSIEKASLSFHGLRYTNARETYFRERLSGKSKWEAFKEINHHLGHGRNRKDITEVYLKEIERDFLENLETYKEIYRLETDLS